MPAPEFELQLPNPYPRRPALVLRVTGKPWTRIAEPHRREKRIVVPDWMVDAHHRVDDETAYRIERGCALGESPSQDIVRGSVVVVLESPHKREFKGPGGVAGRPLQDRNNRRHFEACAPGLLSEAAELTGVDVVGRPLVIANAVQYQTSLQALNERYGSRLERAIRNRVWTELFEAGGGDDLVARLDRYRPALVILAPTKVVAPLLRDRIGLAGRHWPSLLIDEHPSRWWNYPPKIVETVTVAS